MEYIYTLVQPSVKDGTKLSVRNVSSKVADIVSDFTPGLTFDFTVEEKGGTAVTSDIEEFKRLVLRDGWWMIASDYNFLLKCDEYKRLHNKKHTAITEDSAKSNIDKAASKDHVNPAHYQSYFDCEGLTLQWLETMQYLPRFRDQTVFKGAVELQARKYLDRLGAKDESSQEIMKAVWYLKFLAAYIKNGGPVRVKDIDAILNKNESSNGP